MRKYSRGYGKGDIIYVPRQLVTYVRWVIQIYHKTGHVPKIPHYGNLN